MDYYSIIGREKEAATTRYSRAGKLYTWQSNILLPYGSCNSPSLHPGPWPSRCGQTRSTAARYVTWTSDVFLPARNFKRYGCTCSFHSCYEFRVVLPTCVSRYNSVGENGRETKKRNGRFELLQILEIFLERKIIVQTLNYVQWGWMFTCINVKTLEEFFLCPLEGEGGRIALGIYIYIHTRHSFAKGRIEVFSLVKKTFHEEEYIFSRWFAKDCVSIYIK